MAKVLLSNYLVKKIFSHDPMVSVVLECFYKTIQYAITFQVIEVFLPPAGFNVTWTVFFFYFYHLFVLRILIVNFTCSKKYNITLYLCQAQRK